MKCLFLGICKPHTIFWNITSKKKQNSFFKKNKMRNFVLKQDVKYRHEELTDKIQEYYDY